MQEFRWEGRGDWRGAGGEGSSGEGVGHETVGEAWGDDEGQEESFGRKGRGVLG